MRRDEKSVGLRNNGEKITYFREVRLARPNLSESEVSESSNHLPLSLNHTAHQLVVGTSGGVTVQPPESRNHGIAAIAAAKATYAVELLFSVESVQGCEWVAGRSVCEH